MSFKTILPNFTKERSYRTLLLAIGLCVIALGIIIYNIPPGVDPDPCWGFLVMRGMESGHPFNLLLSPDPQNIGIDHSAFLAWWSPGQYLLPYAFKLLFKLNTGHAVSLTIFVCSLTGMAGFYQLFRQLGFSKWTSAISIGFIFSQLFFFSGFRYYTGGETLLFAFLGWFIYGCFRFKNISWRVLLFVFIAGLTGFFAKSSVLWMYAAGLTCLWINVSLNEATISSQNENNHSLSRSITLEVVRKWLFNGLILAIPFIAAIAVIYLFYLSKGANPTSDPANYLVKPETFIYPLASPLLSAFSVDELFDGLLYQPDASNISYHLAIILIIICACSSLIYLYFIKKLSTDKKYPLAVITFYTVGVLFFSYMYFKQVNISYEGRHFRILGLLFIPGLIWLCFKTKVTRVLFFMVWFFYLYTGYHFLSNEISGNRQSSHGNSGLSQQEYDNTTMNAIIKLDRDNPYKALFVVMSPNLAIEVKYNRVITFDDDTPDSEFLSLRYAGKAGTLYMIVPERYVKSGKAATIRKCFVNYHNFMMKELSKDYYLLTAAN